MWSRTILAFLHSSELFYLNCFSWKIIIHFKGTNIQVKYIALLPSILRLLYESRVLWQRFLYVQTPVLLPRSITTVRDTGGTPASTWPTSLWCPRFCSWMLQNLGNDYRQQVRVLLSGATATSELKWQKEEVWGGREKSSKCYKSSTNIAMQMKQNTIFSLLSKST